jgi:hypothetical protein
MNTEAAQKLFTVQMKTCNTPSVSVSFALSHLWWGLSSPSKVLKPNLFCFALCLAAFFFYPHFLWKTSDQIVADLKLLSVGLLPCHVCTHFVNRLNPVKVFSHSSCLRVIHTQFYVLLSFFKPVEKGANTWMTGLADDMLGMVLHSGGWPIPCRTRQLQSGLWHWCYHCASR